MDWIVKNKRIEWIDHRNRISFVAFFIACVGGIRTPVVTTLCADEIEPNQSSAEQLQFFENDVRPLLAKKCVGCHGPEEQEGGLRLDSLTGFLRGGDSGAAFVPRNPDESRLIRAIHYDDDILQMPPDGRLADEQIQTLVRWVKIGAPWPKDQALRPVAETNFEITAKDREFWSFQPIRRSNLPPRRLNSAIPSRNPIDRFVQARLHEDGLNSAPPAQRRALVRRLYFDLTGLPPTLAQITQLVDDPAPDAYERLVDRLLASPKYGERWGRHWLDVVRFAQSNGYERDDGKPFAWRYRDYVVDALNHDKPFDQFVREQLAGDELDVITDDSITATGFMRLGVWDDEPDDSVQAEYDALDDMVVTTGAAFLGLTLGCCRCHDHKFDPLSQEDYYATLAFMRNVKFYVKHDSKEAESTIFAPLPSGKGKALAVREAGPEVAKTNVLIRGNPKTPAQEVSPRFIEVLSDGKSVGDRIQPTSANTAGRRRVLADWMTDKQNPLTARVIVNRLWQHHFGTGIVGTPNDFGQTGIRPTHPELLDWLACELMDGDWNLKPIHRLILMSHTYQQSSAVENESAVLIDPKNKLLWRQNLRRLEAEAIRDAILATSGQLNLEMKGPSVFPNLPADVIASQSMPGRGWGRSTTAERSRRSLYVFSKRGLQVPILESFDFASSEQPIGRRDTTTVAPQALTLLNSDFIDEQANFFADQLLAHSNSQDPVQLVRDAYAFAFARLPTDQELSVAVDYYRSQYASCNAAVATPTLLPKLPSALHRSFMELNKAEHYLAGPRQGWRYFVGDWPARGDGIHWVRSERGPFALWGKQQFSDGEIQLKILLHPHAEVASVIFRAQPRGELFDGYELLFLPERQQVRLQRIAETETTLASADLPIRSGEWISIRIQLTGAKLQVWSDNSEEPRMIAVDPQPIDHAGYLGLRTWVAGLSFRDLLLTAEGKTEAIEAAADGDAHRRSLVALCNLILNLNEFIYVD